MQRERSPKRAQREIAALEVERDRVREAIASYPPPIPACDEQFNHLLEERDRISRELSRLKRAVHQA
jgi:hypothetical protein